MLPYWLAGGPDLCDGCALPHVREVEVRCVACDRGMCEHCVVVLRKTREALCLECHRPEEA